MATDETKEQEQAEDEGKGNDDAEAEVRTKAESDEKADADENPDADEKADAEPSEPPAEEDSVPERMRKARPRGSKAVQPPPPAASLGKSVILFLVVFIGLAAGFAFLGSSDPFSERNQPRWRKGQKVTLNITLDPRDDVKLACASKIAVEGLRCEFETKAQRFAGQTDDKTLLKPYTTTDGVQFLAAGLWTQPELEKAKRPTERFTVACQLTVQGSIASPAIRWDTTMPWNEKNQVWYAGVVSDCKVVKE